MSSGRERRVGARMGRKLLSAGLCLLLSSLDGMFCHASGQMNQELARKIMGNNFLGTGEVIEQFGVRLTAQDVASLRHIPFSEATLRQCKDGYILLLGIERDREGKPLTIQRLRELFLARGESLFRSYPTSSQARQSYAVSETPRLQWYLVARSLREDTRSVPYWQQEQLLAENEYRERAVVYVYMMLLMFKARGQRLFEKDLVWSGDVGSDGAPVAAGYFGPEGLYVSDWWIDRDSHFGIAPARKPDFSTRSEKLCE